MKNRITLTLLKYPNILTILAIVICNLLLNPNICLLEWFNWIQYTDTNPYPFDTWDSAHTNDNPEVSYNMAYTELQAHVLNESVTPDMDSSLENKTLEDSTRRLIDVAMSIKTDYNEIIEMLPHYKDNCYKLEEGTIYPNTYECQLIEAEIEKTGSIRLIELFTILNANHLMHNNYIDKPYDLYILLVKEGIRIYIEKLAEKEVLKRDY
jgi:hypothetical protein